MMDVVCPGGESHEQGLGHPGSGKSHCVNKGKPSDSDDISTYDCVTIKRIFIGTVLSVWIVNSSFEAWY